MAKASLSLVPPARTPERQALADAILERDRRLKLISDKKAELRAEEETGWSGYSRRDDLEEQLRGAAGLGGESARREALLRGEKSEDRSLADLLRSEIAALDADRERSRQRQEVLKSDLALLEGTMLSAVLGVENARAAVIASDPTAAAIVAALEAAHARTVELRGIVNDLFLKVPGMGLSYVPQSRPGEAVYQRLMSDPDAVLPRPDDLFAEPPRPAA